jgi:hypothetical protein
MIQWIFMRAKDDSKIDPLNTKDKAREGCGDDQIRVRSCSKEDHERGLGTDRKKG